MRPWRRRRGSARRACCSAPPRCPATREHRARHAGRNDRQRGVPFGRRQIEVRRDVSDEQPPAHTRAPRGGCRRGLRFGGGDFGARAHHVELRPGRRRGIGARSDRASPGRPLHRAANERPFDVQRAAPDRSAPPGLHQQPRALQQPSRDCASSCAARRSCAKACRRRARSQDSRRQPPQRACRPLRSVDDAARARSAGTDAHPAEAGRRVPSAPALAPARGAPRRRGCSRCSGRRARSARRAPGRRMLSTIRRAACSPRVSRVSSGHRLP